ncbi:MAG: hypothetical protein HN736_10670 [Anaerolineae bacterium]|jgi:hypothetical protein|nr:hypothetical protein [Anaerolineae bacterium]MBT3713297.1 hypothetical protein [Anaerolineae bacterium]MBT4311621.1 hypothetical protein [Anaerolineae bacterium]MBT4459294.1 hypothetical protein [Anaerolineae bacterium]MBT4842133.1 hypothetical protein [Anaerolineae bacterium]
MKNANFERLIKKSFLSLETKFGFKKTKTDYHSEGVVVIYQNPTTEVVLNYEQGEFPWITIADINNPKTARASLDWLLVELGEREAPTTDDAFMPPKMDEAFLEDELQKKSDELLRFGADFLNGDFTLLPNLQERADDYLVECKKFAGRYKS